MLKTCSDRENIRAGTSYLVTVAVSSLGEAQPPCGPRVTHAPVFVFIHASSVLTGQKGTHGSGRWGGGGVAAAASTSDLIGVARL